MLYRSSDSDEVFRPTPQKVELGMSEVPTRQVHWKQYQGKQRNESGSRDAGQWDNGSIEPFYTSIDY
jgi:hypothetical protein